MGFMKGIAKSIRKFLFNRKNTRGSILRLAAIIAGLLVLISIIGLSSPTVFRYTLPLVLAVLVVLSITLLLMLMQFMKAIKLIDRNAVTLSQGNLNIDDIISDKTRGLEVLTSAFNDMKRNLLSYIESTKGNVIILSDAVDKVTKSIDMTYKGNEQIASNISIVAEKAQEQLTTAKQTLQGIEKVNLGADRITTTLGSIENFVETTANLTSDGAKQLDEYSGHMQLISSNLDETSSFIKTLDANLSEINEFGNLIMNITGQLNLLSLNSRVEAARAGEAGKGFAVVAMEMNKLSDATKESVTQINHLLSSILKSNAKVSESIQNVTNTFTMSKEIFDSMKSSFYTINNNASILNSDIKRVYEESVMISESTKVLSGQSAVLHDASGEISNITQDVAAVTQEELAENEEISMQANSLKKMLSGIENLLKRYKTSIPPVSQASPKRLRFVMLCPNNGPHWQAAAQGALYAQTELKDKNTQVDLISFDPADRSITETLDGIIEEGCDGFILPGFVKGLEECARKAATKKIPVMTFNSDFEDTSKRLSYFGPNLQAEGTLAAEILARNMEEEGKVIIFRGNSSSPINAIRRDAVSAKLAKYPDIMITSQIDDIEEPSQLYKKLKEILYYSPDVNGILIIGGGVQGAARAIEELKLTGKIKLYCFEYSDDIINLIRKGVVNMVFKQDYFGQGHDPIIYLYNYLVARELPEKVTYTRTEVIDNYSVTD
ncbi:methyl-accepting chemotaxis protein/ribose transport system substrate-binding protein [Anaerotaenia torta]|uniref:substrate-binding domain-containing protein n=1 Tax=Anaerotaenia torta TaxID=433293 RepID=UPI003D1F0392